MTDTNQVSPLRAGFDPKRALDFARSEMFDRTFKEGMALVEETAAYLDGPGRAASKRLSRAAALAYAGESMRLTTRLMQVASWLLVQRAVRDGEIQMSEAASEKYRLISRDAATAAKLRRRRRTAGSAEDADHPRRRYLRTRAPSGRNHVRRRRRDRESGERPDG